MTQYCGIQMDKYKTALDGANMANHNSREKISENENLKNKLTRPELTKHNIALVPCKDIYEAWLGKTAGLKRKPQKNASFLCEAKFYVSHSFFEPYPDEADKEKFDAWKRKARDYFGECLEWAKKEWGDYSILQADIHLDETTPHMHVLMCPLVKNKKGELAYSSGSFFKGRNGIALAQTSLAKEVGNKWGLQRGVEDSEAKHTKAIPEAKAAVAQARTEKAEAQKAISKAKAEKAQAQKASAQAAVFYSEARKSFSEFIKKSGKNLLAGFPETLATLAKIGGSVKISPAIDHACAAKIHYIITDEQGQKHEMGKPRALDPTRDMPTGRGR